MILSDKEILTAMGKGLIVIRPFDPKCLGSNSYDIHLGNEFAVYTDAILDAKKDNSIDYFTIPEEGYIINPGQLYLGVTKEYTETKGVCAFFGGEIQCRKTGHRHPCHRRQRRCGVLQSLDSGNLLQTPGTIVQGHAHRSAHLLYSSRKCAKNLR